MGVRLKGVLEEKPKYKDREEGRESEGQEEEKEYSDAHSEDRRTLMQIVLLVMVVTLGVMHCVALLMLGAAMKKLGEQEKKEVA